MVEQTEKPGKAKQAARPRPPGGDKKVSRVPVVLRT